MNILKKLGTIALLILGLIGAWVRFEQERERTEREHKWKMWVMDSMEKDSETIAMQQDRIQMLIGRVTWAEEQLMVLKRHHCHDECRLAAQRMGER